MLPTLTYSKHAAERMAQRGFTEADVRLMLAKGAATPDKTHPGKLNIRLMLRGREAKLAYVVVSRSELVIVSIMWRDEEK